MPGTLSGNFGTRKRPATLDFGQIIARIEWALGPSILMLHFEASSEVHPPRTIDVSAIGIGTISSVFDNPIHIHDNFNNPVPTVVNPMSLGMVSHTLVWNRAPKKPGGGSDNVFEWKAVLFLNIGRIKTFYDIEEPDNHYDIVVRFPASEKTTETGVILYAFADVFGWEYHFSHPQVTGAIIDDHGTFGIVGTVQVFGSETARSDFLGWNSGSLPPWVAHDEPASGDVYDRFAWQLRAYTFKRRKDFPLKSDTLLPDFSLSDDKAKDAKSDNAHATVDVQIPAITVTVTVNTKTLALTMKRA